MKIPASIHNLLESEFVRHNYTIEHTNKEVAEKRKRLQELKEERTQAIADYDQHIRTLVDEIEQGSQEVRNATAELRELSAYKNWLERMHECGL